ncbi:hypothetical protein GCM10023317_46960 [Actinopolymorpha pittospori]|uniref:Uncharacterized protein n=1 Tax=Actinopolymorpha pittospori TaxID=648752 RepID=A0A927R696_9ACTN|nr:hypothetical protein [Actinopolymorpha pittospori]
MTLIRVAFLLVVVVLIGVQNRVGDEFTRVPVLADRDHTRVADDLAQRFQVIEWRRRVEVAEQDGMLAKPVGERMGVGRSGRADCSTPQCLGLWSTRTLTCGNPEATIAARPMQTGITMDRCRARGRGTEHRWLRRCDKPRKGYPPGLSVRVVREARPGISG